LNSDEYVFIFIDIEKQAQQQRGSGLGCQSLAGRLFLTCA